MKRIHISTTSLWFFLAIALLTACQSKKQPLSKEKPAQLTVQEMRFDFDTFQGIFEAANAGLYRYHSKGKIDSLFAENRKQISAKTTYRELYKTIWRVMDYTGSCHNNLFYPDSLWTIIRAQDIFFPIPLKFLDNKLLINFAYEGIPVGSEIVAINNIPANLFALEISHFTSSDGYNTTGKYAFIETGYLAKNIYYAFGAKKSFEISYKQADTKLKTKTVSSVDYDTFNENFSKRHTKTYEDLRSEAYSFRHLDSINTDYLEVRTFGMGGPDTIAQQKYEQFLDSVFINLKEKATPKLIVDIRDNGGGYDPNDLLLYSYLTARKFRENKSAFTVFQDIPFPAYYIDDDIEELPIKLKEEHSILVKGKYYQNENFNPFWEPNDRAFQGEIVLLVDAFVASAGSMFASLVKSDDNTMVIGEETAGGYHGHTGHIPVNYSLPNSKLILNFSIVDLEQDVKDLTDQTYGDGIMPDHIILQTFEDFMEDKDTQLTYAIEFMRDKKVD